MRISGWISDVCSSDLLRHHPLHSGHGFAHPGDQPGLAAARLGGLLHPDLASRDRGVHRAAPTDRRRPQPQGAEPRSEEHTSELQSLMRISYAVFCLKKKTEKNKKIQKTQDSIETKNKT